jgi:hypothetical protein
VPFIKCVSVRWGFEQGLLPEQRAAFADFATKIAVGYQPMEWLTWIAEFDSTAFSQADIDKYNDDMKRVSPDLVATRVVVSAAGIGRDTEIESIAGALYEFDSKIAKHLVVTRAPYPIPTGKRPQCGNWLICTKHSLMQTMPLLPPYPSSSGGRLKGLRSERSTAWTNGSPLALHRIDGRQAEPVRA